jgi:hypothetical protein
VLTLREALPRRLILRLRRTPLRLLSLALVLARAAGLLLLLVRLLAFLLPGVLGVCHVHFLLSRRAMARP